MWELAFRDSVIEGGSAEPRPLKDLCQAENRIGSCFTSFEIHRCPRIEQFICRSKMTQHCRVERAVGIESTHCQVGSLAPHRLAMPAQQWSRKRELKPRPSDYRLRALPTELSLDTNWCRVQFSDLNQKMPRNIGVFLVTAALAVVLLRIACCNSQIHQLGCL